MGKKKKKDVDFQKVKLKIGRKLKRDSNETKAEFKSRKIILKEVRDHKDDPLLALAHHSDHISQHGKLSLINHFNSALNPTIIKTLNKPTIDSLAKFIIDHSDQVRSATYRCLKTCINHIKQQHLSIKDFVYLLKPYLDCAYTHISKPTVADSQKFLEYLLNINEPQICEPLMSVVLKRYEAGNLTLGERNLALRLKNLYLKNRQKLSLEEQAQSDKIEPLLWTESNFVLDLDWIIHDFGNKRQLSETRDRDVLLVPKQQGGSVVEKFLCTVFEEGVEGVA